MPYMEEVERVVKVLQAIHGEFDREVFTIVKEMFEAGAEVKLISPRWPSKGVTIHHSTLSSPLRIMPKPGGGQITGFQTALRRMQAGKKTPDATALLSAMAEEGNFVTPQTVRELKEAMTPQDSIEEEEPTVSTPQRRPQGSHSNGEAAWLNASTVGSWMKELEAKAELYDEAVKEADELKAQLKAAREEVIEVKKQVAEDKAEIEAWYASMSRIGQRFGKTDA